MVKFLLRHLFAYYRFGWTGVYALYFPVYWTQGKGKEIGKDIYDLATLRPTGNDYKYDKLKPYPV